MRNQFLALKLAILSCLIPIAAQAQTSFVIFGDSLSDNGNAFRATGGLIPPSPPYFQGRFTNGTVWVESLSSNLNLTQTTNNLAFGGATSGTANTVTPLLPGVTTQVNGFLQTSPQGNRDRLFSIWAGANDYLGGGVTNPTLVVGNISTALQRLTAAGAEKILVVNLPDLGRIPASSGSPAQSAALSQLTAAHNSALRSTLQTLAQSNPNVMFVPIDVASLFNEVQSNPARFGFTNVTDACLNTLTGATCANPNQFLFWDNLHPTAAAHQIIGAYAFNLLLAPSAIAPQTEIALNVAQRPTRDLNGRLLTLRTSPPTQGFGVFVNGDFNFFNRDATANSIGFDSNTKGVTVGADYGVTDDLALGLALSYGNNNTDLDSNLGEVSVNSFSISAYGSYSRDRFFADALINYGWNNFDITRNINVTGFNQADAETDGTQFSIRANTGYNLGNNALTIAPVIGIRYTKVNIDGYTENNGSVLNLQVNDQDADSVVLNLGAQVSYKFQAPFGTVEPFFAANYEREFANGSREIVAELATQPGIPMRTETEESDRDFVRLSAGIQTQFANNLSAGISYETILGKENVSDHTIQAQLRYQF